MAVTDPTRVRTTVNVDREVYATFVQMAELSRMSVSKCIGEWLADTADGAQFVALKMKEARESPMLVMREMQAMSVGLHETVAATIDGIRKAAAGGSPASGSAGGSTAAVAGKSSRGAPSSNTGRKVQERTTRRGGKS